jgi:TorA maturation chaperone TorD
MKDAGLELALRATGGTSELARKLGISQPSVSNWTRVPAERVLAVEALSGVDRKTLRPDLYPDDAALAPIDDVDRGRAAAYRLLATVLRAAPEGRLLQRLAALSDDGTPLGRAQATLAAAAAASDASTIEREFFALFIGVGRGELLPYASFYLTGFLHERPLARVREDLAALGLARADSAGDPEDHLAFLCEVMAGLVDGGLARDASAASHFFARHLAPWASRFFADLAQASSARFYRAVAAFGTAFIEIESEAFALPE